MAESKARLMAGNFSITGTATGGLDSADVNVLITSNSSDLDSADVQTIAGPLSNRNMVINGSMVVSQRGTSFVGLNGYGLDRWVFSGSHDGAVTVTQDTTVPPGQGFQNSIKFDVTSADTSIAAAQFYQFFQRIEGHNVAHLEWGTANAKSVTLSFWIRSNVTGTYNVYFLNNDINRFCPVNYTIDSANTWEKKTITIAGDTTGTWLTNNSIGLYVLFNLALGSNNLTGTNATWATSGAGISGTTQANLLSSDSNELYITGIQLEAGSTATPFEFENVGNILAKCKRYYQRYNRQANYSGLGMAVPWSTTNANLMWFMEVEPRANPTIEYGHLSHFDYFGVTGAGAGGGPTGFSNSGWAGGNNMDIGFTGSGFSAARAMLIEFDNTATNLPAFLAINAEL